ncbi:PAP2 superfamily protein [Loktanella fryxellensis]|uniref:PAP2 superfamily protein n=1 Tax=Loktanella fryxellensis TaxID=245187 RepID=A0A1H8CAY2_9RHOB|nr:vanadium-dependent haloperoxidase [Loktanella fryxellensis]SEM92190.1 PAP2 superfamily protein [Loktanella fryxellensis]
MRITRRQTMALLLASACPGAAFAQTPLTAPAAMPPDSEARARDAIDGWYRLILELVRHTPTYSPPVAARAFGYLGVTAWEATVAAHPGLRSLAGQLSGLTSLPAGDGTAPDHGVILNAALAAAVPVLFANTGPTGQRAMAAMTDRLATRVAEGVGPAVVSASAAHGAAIAAHVLAWSDTDGGAVVANMGFPMTYPAVGGPADWVPTSLVRQQQMPLLPEWGQNRTFAMPTGADCGLPPPPDWSTAPDSAFYAEARAVYDTTTSLTPDQLAIARFWSDDPMLSPTPPGHWITIARIVLDDRDADAVTRADALARVGIGLADALIACWHAKFEYDLLRPVTYIKAHIDPAWQPLLITPPFPEYPSGHSTLSGTSATVLAAVFGPDTAFVDTTHADDGLPDRSFSSFWDAAEEAGISRLYGGIHFPSAIARGLEQGRCVAGWTNALVTRP